tara:strand:+ start:191 stop:544 length:354 start_codon:yes stop_codon:yes gene_type:complete
MSTEYQAKMIVGISLNEKEFFNYLEKFLGKDYLEENRKYTALMLENFTYQLFGEEGESFFVENEKEPYKFGIIIDNDQYFADASKNIMLASQIFSEKFNYKFKVAEIPKLICDIFSF